jgi:type IV pilus assembly protein PilC
MGYLPVAIEQHSMATLKREIQLPFGNKVKPRDVAIFSRQFATMINAGLSLLRALNILEGQTENKKFAEIIGVIRSDVEKGQPLSAAMAKHPKAFNRLYISMLRAGETGGVLDDVLTQLADIVEKQVELKRKIKAALAYPVAVLGLVLLIVTAMLVFVVPTFKKLYADLGGTLPLPTQILLKASSLITTYMWLIVVVAVGATAAFKRWIGSPSGRAVWDDLKLKMPIFGGLVHKSAMTRFSRTFSVLLGSGVPILEALEITSDTVDNAVVSRAVLRVKEAVQQGQTISGPLTSEEIFPPMVTQMLAVGEETGAVDTMLLKVAEFYEQEVEATVEALTSLLEPLLIVVLGGAVGAMVVALYVPMFKIINLVH